MTRQKIAHVIAQNQLDARNNLFVTRTVTLSHKQRLDDYLQELAATRATYSGIDTTLTLDMLPHDEQLELMRLFIEAIDREIEDDFIHGLDYNINNDYTCALLNLLANDNAKNRQALARITQKNLLKHYESALNNALDVACTAYVSNQLNEASYHQVHDVNHGDDFWVQC